MREYNLKFYPLFVFFIICLALSEGLEFVFEKYQILDTNNFDGWNLFAMILCGFLFFVVIQFILVKIYNPRARMRLFFLPELFGIAGVSNSSMSFKYVRFILVLPFILLSIIPFSLSLVIDSYSLYKFSFYMLLASLGNLYMLYLTRKEKGENMAIDKEDAKGLLVYDKE